MIMMMIALFFILRKTALDEDEKIFIDQLVTMKT
jgi:hypothetical protein